MIVNGLGTAATGATVIVVIIAKFAEGAWITLVAIPSLLALMYAVWRHYDKLHREIGTKVPLDTREEADPMIVIPITSWTRVGREALRFAMTLSTEIRVVHVAVGEASDEFAREWAEYVAKPAKAAQLPMPELVQLKSPYRFVVSPIVDYVVNLARENPERRIVTMIPELMEKRWYYFFLHTQRATLLKTRLLMEGNDRVSVLNIP